MDPLAVMVHIHGDTYDEGSANMYDGSILASYGGVIVITVNYRLGILGFLSTADSAARGNYGLMDQIAAIKWIHQNIGVFGGDPDQITLFGVGSGAACSGLLMFSNHTKGLIAGVIAESGSANAPWALSREPARFAKLLAENVGCEAETNLQMVECLRGLPYSDLINLDFQSPLYMFAFAPVVDEDVIAADPSIMWGQLIAGERDIGRDDFAYLSGIVRNEAFSYIAEETDVVGRMELEVFDDILDGFVQNNFGGNMKASVIRDVIYYEYMDWGGGEGNAFTLKDSLQDILTDHQWVAPCISSLKLADEAGIDAWLYMFPHRPRRSIYPRWAGAVHLEEVPYVFGAPVSNMSVGIFTESYSSAEAALSLATMNYWSNFAKSGNPNSPRPQSSTDIHRNFVVEFNFETMEDWPRYTVGRQQMIYLASNPKAKDFYRVHKISLWEQLVPRIEQKFAFEPTVNNNPFLPGPQISNPGGGQVTHSLTSAMQPVTSAISPMTDPFETDIDNRVPGADNITPSGTESNALETDKQEKKGFLVELSMVIAIGGFLLLLNLIILGAIYYLRDKRKIEKRLAQKYLTSQTEEKKRTSLHPQTTPDSGIGIPVALNLNQQSGHHGSNQRYGTPSVPSRAGTSDHNHGNGGSRDYSSLKYNRSPQHFGAIRRNSAGEVEFEV
ncbi:neuroligin-4, X-linked isoform X2 [Strongylocentrotus purpuratus]|uniref:Carboxylesterase type B domain-containing protein n=1 Tax=Strongylocentrotus purpuratus TaxID=7668 RepID=A0A7M7NKW0_STRPU|nr:neuroligin-4, X-linked isoform X2 [Strongylocentrotus purpuratus]